MSNVGLQVRQAVPSIDPIVAEYAVGYIQHVSNSTEDSVLAQQVDIPQEMEFINDLLVQAGGSLEKVEALTQGLKKQLSDKLNENMEKLALTGDTSKRLLDINVLQNNTKRDINSSLALLNSGNDIAHTGRQMESRVDKKRERLRRKLLNETTNLSNMKLPSY